MESNNCEFIIFQIIDNYVYLFNRVIIYISYILLILAYIIVIKIIFEARRPCETLAGVLDLNNYLCVIFIFSEFNK